MVDLRCNKCGSCEGFLIETQDGKEMPIKARLNVDRILKSVHVTCTYCNNDWAHVPIRIVDKDPIEVTQ